LAEEGCCSQWRRRWRQNRQNYAQDLQISSRGFGVRATFGVRGIRLIADGIPATMPGGQGQASTFALALCRRSSGRLRRNSMAPTGK
jgi:hypothetical protein